MRLPVTSSLTSYRRSLLFLFLDQKPILTVYSEQTNQLFDAVPRDWKSLAARWILRFNKWFRSSIFANRFYSNSLMQRNVSFAIFFQFCFNQKGLGSKCLFNIYFIICFAQLKFFNCCFNIMIGLRSFQNLYEHCLKKYNLDRNLFGLLYFIINTWA